MIKKDFENIVIGTSKKLEVEFTPENTTNKDVEWKTENENIIPVSKTGEMTGVGVGKTNITAKHGNLISTVEVEVVPVLAEFIEINNLSLSDKLKEDEIPKYVVGCNVEFTAHVLPENVTDKTIKWSVNDESIAQINQQGILTTKEEGIVTVTAETVNGVKAIYEIEIYKTSLITNIMLGAFTIIVCIFIIGVVAFFIRKKRRF